MAAAPINTAAPAASPKWSALLNSARRWIRLTKRRIIIIFLALIALAVLADFFVPREHIPWRPLDIEAPMGLATGTKITLIALGPSRICLGKLEQAGSLDYQRAAPRREGKTCGWDVALNMTAASGAHFRPRTVTAQCPLMLAGYIWLRAVDEAAQKRLGSGLKKVHHAGTYSCRRQRGNSSGAWSEHAFANAWDITGFELKDGRVISVRKHWKKGKTKDSKARAKFLRDARGSACRVFRVVLTPDFNKSHIDHFHLDQGPSLSCK